ncbi:MAG: hypothetical protein HYY06_04430 [Deltaproteobacteria bacterium]|nr:hypothetical protein [Deltaproteobacteria bacterium]
MDRVDTKGTGRGVRRAVSAALIAALAVSLPVVATAQPVASWDGFQSTANEPPLRVAHERPEARRWYGWQILVVDFASMMLIPAAGIGVGGYALGGPIVHWAQGETGRGFGSLAMRVLSPTLLGLGGAAVMCANGECDGEMGGLAAAVGLLIGAAIGAVSAIAVDVAVLGYGPAEPT